MGLHSNGRLIALPTNNGLGWKRMAVTNTLAYYNMATVKYVKSFIVRASAIQNLFTVVKSFIACLDFFKSYMLLLIA